ncbi:MAG: uracil-DNA glycosylase family protein [Gammaproteobacteria bacterium]
MLTKQQQYILQEMGIPIWQERIKPSASIEALGASPLNLTESAIGFDNAGWEQLRQEAMTCTKCQLCETRTNVVFGVGNPQAELVIVGEAPGANEDRLGEPFVGRAGNLLDAMLEAIDLQRKDIYICNILKCRPPNNRDPAPEEVAKCTPYLERQLAYMKPKLILAVGRIAAHYLLGVDTALGKLRGQRLQFANTGTDLFVTYHPAYLLRNPRDKAKAYQDLLRVKAFLATSSS